MKAISAETIREAREQLPAELRASPQFVHDGLSRRLGRQVVVKIERGRRARAGQRLQRRSRLS